MRLIYSLVLAQNQNRITGGENFLMKLRLVLLIFMS